MTPVKESALERETRERYGYTNDAFWIERVRDFVAAAIADGWSVEPTYGNEPAERACRLRRDGFSIQAVMRDDHDTGGKYRYWTSLDGWGPDGLSVRLPDVYDMDAIRSAITRCALCGATNMQTHRFSFAGRCCEACLPAARAKHEKPGWNN